MNDFIIRKAEEKDIDFIVHTIIESDKSSTDTISAVNIFSIPLDEYQEVLRKILLENIEDNEYWLSGYLVAEYEGKVVGALSSWIEERDGLSNALIKSNLLMEFVDKEKLVKRGKELELIQSLTFERTTKSIQLEYGFVSEEFRRRGIFSKLIQSHIKLRLNEDPEIYSAQSIIYPDNIKSFNALLKVGFHIKVDKIYDDDAILKYFAFKRKAMMELNGEQLESYK